MYKELNDVKTLHYNKYSYGMAPNDQKNRYYYGMKNPNYYQHNMVQIQHGDENEGAYDPITGAFNP